MIKVGDKIYFIKYGKYPFAFETIIKKTPTMYKTKSYTLRVDEEYIHIVGQNKWDSAVAKLANKELDDLWDEQKIISWFNNKKFTIEEKKQIYNILQV